MMERRAFVLAFSAFAASIPVLGRARTENAPTVTPAPTGAVKFPNGVASGDPSPQTVVLWTRAVPADATRTAVTLTLQVSSSDDFASVVVEENLSAKAEDDFTARAVIADLAPDTFYFYRFIADGDPSLIGRTRTAPLPDANRTVNLALVSCQNYETGRFASYRHMIDNDARKPADKQIDFVLHVGDFIYEAIFSVGRRSMPGFAGGGGSDDGGLSYAKPIKTTFAASLDDYRHLYRTYLTDTDLIAARARWPFICTWDDHEFSNDSFQSYATYAVDPELRPERKIAANRAWFEYIPAHLSGLGDDQPAHNFRNAAEQTNAAAIDSLQLYRSFRWGQHAEVIVTDTRSYRSEHPVPTDVALAGARHPRAMLSAQLIETCDAGRTSNGGKPPATLTSGGKSFPNVRRDTAPGTALGPEQKAWWKRRMKESRATWKLWASSVPLSGLRFDLNFWTGRQDNDLCAFTTDAWDGYPTERRELLRFLADNRVRNVLVLSGDHHAHFTGVMGVDPFSPSEPVVAEFVTTAISSTSLLEVMAGAARTLSDQQRAYPFVIDDRDGTTRDAFNALILYGVEGTERLRHEGLAEARKALKRFNPHIRYADTKSYGYVLVEAGANGAEARHVTIAPEALASDGPVLTMRTASVRLKPGTAEQLIRIEEPAISGTGPYPSA